MPWAVVFLGGLGKLYGRKPHFIRVFSPMIAARTGVEIYDFLRHLGRLAGQRDDLSKVGRTLGLSEPVEDTSDALTVRGDRPE